MLNLVVFLLAFVCVHSIAYWSSQKTKAKDRQA